MEFVSFLVGIIIVALVICVVRISTSKQNEKFLKNEIKHTEPEPEPEHLLSKQNEEIIERNKQLNQSKTARSKPIFTRTSPTETGLKANELWAGERTWTKEEIVEIVDAYESGLTPTAIAIKFGWDTKDVIFRLTREYFDFSGDLENDSFATNNRLRWTNEEHEALILALYARESLESLASRFGRTGLAIGWRLLDRHLIRF